ncbi:UNVERIFIED_CONTAM: hypothetical protein Slati_1350100 [Sesamum latifolium]|uniref:CCHC-type domain-containing protein n=1 Tax=Sesamum latifolium TaxID=2727402 RepID=A0AAW2XPI3_9LAMI
MMTPRIAETIGNRMGQFLEYDKSNSWGASIRIQVSLDVRLPLKRFLQIRTTTGELTVSFTYERLPNFCYGCGVLGHIVRDCPKLVEDPEVLNRTELQYGPWLRESRTVGLPLQYSDRIITTEGIGRDAFNYSGPWGRSARRRGVAIFYFAQSPITGKNQDTSSTADVEAVEGVGAEQGRKIAREGGEFSGERRRPWEERGKEIAEEGDEHVHILADHAEAHFNEGQGIHPTSVEQPARLPSIQKEVTKRIQPIIEPTPTSPSQSVQPGQIPKHSGQAMQPAHTKFKPIHTTGLPPGQPNQTNPYLERPILNSSPTHLLEPDPLNLIKHHPSIQSNKIDPHSQANPHLTKPLPEPDSNNPPYLSSPIQGTWSDSHILPHPQSPDICKLSVQCSLPQQLPTEQDQIIQINGGKKDREGVSSTVSSPLSESSHSTSIEGGGLINIPISFVQGQSGQRGGRGRRGRGRSNWRRGSLKRKEGFHDGETAANKPMLFTGKEKGLQDSIFSGNFKASASDKGHSNKNVELSCSEASDAGALASRLDVAETAESAGQLRRDL